MRLKNILRNPVLFGIVIALGAMLVNLSITTLAEGSIEKGFEALLDNGIFVILVPLTIGIQMSLFKYHRNLVTKCKMEKSEKIGMSGIATSSGSMVLCCLHHVTDVLPTFGFLVATTSFLSEYRFLLITFGLLINVLISIYILNLILKDMKVTNISNIKTIN